jgi:hypothetical protein
LREDLSDELLVGESLPRLHDADNGSFDGVATILLKLLGIVRLVHHSDGDAESQTLGAREQRRGEREFRDREQGRWEGKGQEKERRADLNFSLQEKTSELLIELEDVSFLRILILPQAKECMTLLKASSGSWYMAIKFS